MVGLNVTVPPLRLVVPVKLVEPLTCNPVNVPTFVIFGCAAVDKVPVSTVPELPIVAALTLDALTLDALTLDALTLDAFRVFTESAPLTIARLPTDTLPLNVFCAPPTFN